MRRIEVRKVSYGQNRKKQINHIIVLIATAVMALLLYS